MVCIADINQEIKLHEEICDVQDKQIEILERQNEALRSELRKEQLGDSTDVELGSMPCLVERPYKPTTERWQCSRQQENDPSHLQQIRRYLATGHGQKVMFMWSNPGWTRRLLELSILMMMSCHWLGR